MNQPGFGKELVKIRKAKGLTQSELADKCEVSNRTIQRIESGQTTPRSFTIKALSAALGFDFQTEILNDSKGTKKNANKRFILDFKIISQTIDLFNLKTNTMKKVTLLSVIFGLIGAGLFVISTRTIAQGASTHMNFSIVDSIIPISKKEAVKRIEEINRRATFHNLSLNTIENYAKKSNCNFDTYVILGELISNFGHSTEPVMKIAKIVFLSYNDCDLFNEIAPLIFLNKHESIDTYIKMAKEASKAKTEEDLNKIKEQVNNYKKQAEYQTLEEAYKKQ